MRRQRRNVRTSRAGERLARWGRLLLVLVVPSHGAMAQGAADFHHAVRDVLDAAVRRPSDTLETRALRRIYDSAGVQPLWSHQGQPTDQARRVMALLADAASRGLRPEDYLGEALVGRLRTAAMGASLADIASLDVAVTRALLAFTIHGHRGRVDGRALGFAIPHNDEPGLFADAARLASRSGDPATVVDALEPPFAEYRALRRLLNDYRALAADTSLRFPATRTTVRPGDAYLDAPILERLLRALGDLRETRASSGDVVSTPATYTPALAGAVAAFQQRHGLEPDSVIGTATLAQLRTPLAHRVRQVEFALERWRWLPHRAPSRLLIVNAAAFQVDGFDDDSGLAAPVISMKVIVGKATGRHATPMFSGEVREVVFHPYWDVPPRIARLEVVPLIRRRPGYAEREGFEIVTPGDGSIAPLTSENLRHVATGAWRIRQRPGPLNALGAVKVVFPNRHNVYLHGTPAQHLFASVRRDFSHGCIRVEDPPRLAAFVLRGQAPWDEGAVAEAIADPRTRHVAVARTTEVYVVYATAVVRAGRVTFFPDIYRRDAALALALGLGP